MATTQPRRSAGARGLRNKRSPSQLSLMDPSQRGRARENGGSYLSNMLPKEPAPTEPQCLAAPSVHKSSDNRRDLMASQQRMRSSRRGLRGNGAQSTSVRRAIARKVSESSLFSSGSGHSSLGGNNDCTLYVGRPSLYREVSGLGESSRSFFCDDYSMQHSSSRAFEVPTDEVPPSSSFPGSMNISSSSRKSTSTREHRTLEDISMQAQSEYGNQDDENYEIEISPGEYLPFRGSQETWRAVYSGHTMETTCLECGLQLVSVNDCQCVVCSDCRMVNPVFEHPRGVTAVHGAGLGLQKDWLQQRGLTGGQIHHQVRDFARR